MNLNICCKNKSCVYYFEKMCLNKDLVKISENGDCESFKEGQCEKYKDMKKKDKI